jgi:hypothetical protein
MSEEITYYLEATDGSLSGAILFSNSDIEKIAKQVIIYQATGINIGLGCKIYGIDVTGREYWEIVEKGIKRIEELIGSE